MNDIVKTEQDGTELDFRPTHECAITVRPLKRTNLIHIRGALFKGLWEDETDSKPQELIEEWGVDCIPDGLNHLAVAETIVDHVWSSIKHLRIESMRFTSGKFVVTGGHRRYDNMVDGHVGALLRTNNKKLLSSLIAEMLQLSRNIKLPNKEIENGSQVRALLTEPSGCRALPPEV